MEKISIHQKNQDIFSTSFTHQHLFEGSTNDQTPNPTLRWSEQKANAWYKKNGWIVGCNYIPATAINQLEMWQEETFDPITIDKELSWAAALGFNTIRVFLHNLVWEQDHQSYLRRIDWFLSIAAVHGIRTILVLFDSVWDPNPSSGKQPDPRLHVHNSGWVQCPGYQVLNNTSRYEELHSYVHGIVDYFKNDDRVLLWDLFNEPDNMNLTSYKDDFYVQHKAELSMQLLQKTIQWVRAINPIQPITMAPWQWTSMETLSELDNYMFNHSDIISFHCYENKKDTESRILSLKKFNRPMVCTEYMARALGSTFQEILPLLKKYNVGACNWGLVQGKSQTHCCWNSWHNNTANEPEQWFHDILRPNGEPYDRAEEEFIKKVTRTEKKTSRKKTKADFQLI
ncbi:MAG: glycoside hydrolase family 5 protein [Bacteroidota bacterium]|nr:glycoside hydrolase family 5 protein [Bacteroidota bacterium]